MFNYKFCKLCIFKNLNRFRFAWYSFTWWILNLGIYSQLFLHIFLPKVTRIILVNFLGIRMCSCSMPLISETNFFETLIFIFYFLSKYVIPRTVFNLKDFLLLNVNSYHFIFVPKFLSHCDFKIIDKQFGKITFSLLKYSDADLSRERESYFNYYY